MSLTIGPDLGDTTVISDSGNRWTVTYSFKDTEFNNGAKASFTAEFPRDFNEINVDEVEQFMMGLAMAVARGKNVHS